MATPGSSRGAKPPTRIGVLRKILIVDRDEYWGPATSLALEEAGYYLNWVKDAAEGRRRAYERVYDLLVLSDSMGERALTSILEAAGRHSRPPAVLVVSGPDDMKNAPAAAPPLSVLRRPCRVGDVVDAARALVGAAWSEHRKGA